MNTSSIGDKVGSYNLCVVQEDRAIPPSHEDWVAILRMDQIAISEVRGVIRASQTMTGQRCEERSWTVRYITVRMGKIVHCRKGFIVWAYAC